jgi:hypothetical protein
LEYLRSDCRANHFVTVEQGIEQYFQQTNLKQHYIPGGGDGFTLYYFDRWIMAKKASLGYHMERTQLLAIDRDRRSYNNFLNGMKSV